MLSYDSLLEHARERGMPLGKLRGLVREYIQILVLKTLYSFKNSQDLLFLGGTALRLGYGMKRFSQDLDFDAREMPQRGWRDLIEKTAHALARWGLSPEVRVGEKGSVLSGDLRFPDIYFTYQLGTQRGEKLQVKVQANRPRYPLAAESRVISGFGEMFPVVFASPDLFFAEKIMALLNREMARDVYDIYFMAGKRWKPDARALAAKRISGNPAVMILNRITGWGTKILTRMAKQIEPFLFEPSESQLVEKAIDLLPSFLSYLKNSG